MAHEVWDEYYDRLASLIRDHRTTLVFVNTWRMSERLTLLDAPFRATARHWFRAEVRRQITPKRRCSAHA